MHTVVFNFLFFLSSMVCEDELFFFKAYGEVSGATLHTTFHVNYYVTPLTEQIIQFEFPPT